MVSVTPLNYVRVLRGRKDLTVHYREKKEEKLYALDSFKLHLRNICE